MQIAYANLQERLPALPDSSMNTICPIWRPSTDRAILLDVDEAPDPAFGRIKQDHRRAGELFAGERTASPDTAPTDGVPPHTRSPPDNSWPALVYPRTPADEFPATSPEVADLLELARVSPLRISYSLCSIVYLIIVWLNEEKKKPAPACSRRRV